MPADMNDYFKKRNPSNNNNSGGGGSEGGGNDNKFRLDLPFNGGGSNKFMTWIVSLVILVALFLALKPFTIINSGEVGHQGQYGKI